MTATDLKAKPEALAQQAVAFAKKHPGVADQLRVDQVKVFADGVVEAPTWTAAMNDPYLDKDGKPTTNRGELYVDPELFKQQVAALHKNRFSLHVHAIGDRAVRVALDAFAASESSDGGAVFRDQIVHLQVVDPTDTARFAKLNVIAGVQGDWAFREEYGAGARTVYGSGPLQKCLSHQVVVRWRRGACRWERLARQYVQSV